MSWDRSVGTVTGPGNNIFGVRISVGASNFFSTKTHRQPLGPTLAHTENVQGALSQGRGVKLPGRAAVHSPPPSAEEKHKTRNIPRAHKDSSSRSLHPVPVPVPVDGRRPVPNNASATTDRPNKWRRYLLHCTTFSARCANQRPNVLLSPPPGGEALWTGRETGRSERTSQAAGLTPSIAMDKYINRDSRRVAADLQQWPSRYVSLHHST